MRSRGWEVKKPSFETALTRLLPEIMRGNRQPPENGKKTPEMTISSSCAKLRSAPELSARKKRCNIFRGLKT
jgi:hypothetical protein